MKKTNLLVVVMLFMLFPSASRAAQPVDVKIIFNGSNSPATGTIDYAVYSGTWQNSADTSVTIETQDGSGSHEIPAWNSLEKSFNISQSLQPGWRPSSIYCTGNDLATSFTYTVKEIERQSLVHVTLAPGETAITCTFENQYFQDWLRHSYESDIKIIAKTIGGDGTFNYNLASTFWDQTPNRNFSITTTNGYGEYYLQEWNPKSGSFMLYQQTGWDSWNPATVTCTNTEPDGKFTYNPDPNPVSKSIYVQVPLGYNRITCTFTIEKKPTDKFVYVALGDSYQSGEGAGNSVADTSTYLNTYENGSNYLQADRTQTNTYNPDVNYGPVSIGGDGCHRALQNYAKINKDKLRPDLNDEDIVLIDETCSGATIESSTSPGAKPPIVGNALLGQINPDSQIAKALAQLESVGLTANDVDLVTVGMGGNDAKFPDLIQACMLASFTRKVLNQYPDRPAEVETIANQFATCQEFDDLLFDTNGAIDDLLDEETKAQDKILSAFANARVMQLNYPSIIPTSDNLVGSNSCGGIRKEDLNYLRDKVKKINDKIGASVNAMRALGNTRLELVDISNIFGSNPLCSPTPNMAYANGIDENNFNAEIDRLLNTNNQGDQASRDLLDKVFADYGSLSHCAWWEINCRPTSLAKIALDGKNWVNYLNETSRYKKIVGNLAIRTNKEDNNIRFDRSMGLYHPNAKGHELTACYVKTAFNQTSSDSCLPSFGPVFADSANGKAVGNAPIAMSVGGQFQGDFGGFDADTSRFVELSSMPFDLGTFTSDSNGVVHVSFTMPDIGPGVHTLKITGNSAAKTELIKQVRLQIPGNPAANSSYGMYLTGFTPNDGTAEPDKIDINYLGTNFETLTPDEDGGVFVELPTFDQSGPVTVTARSQTTNQEVTKTINIITDKLPPVTTPTVNGTMGQAGYYRSDVIIDMVATDTAQEGVTASGVQSINYSLDGAATSTVNEAATTAKVTSEGNHSLVYYSIDKNGNQETAKTLNFTIDKTTPIMGLTPVSGTAAAPFNFIWNIVDTLSGIDTSTCNIKVDSVSVSTGCSGSYTLAAGIHTVVASASDNTGNVGSDTRTYNIANPDAGILIVNKKAGISNAAFNFKVIGPANLVPTITTLNGTGTTGNISLPVGQYTLSEIVPAGWALTGTSCSSVCTGSCSTSISQRNGVVTFRMVKNLKVTCKFTNTKK